MNLQSYQAGKVMTSLSQDCEVMIRQDYTVAKLQHCKVMTLWNYDAIMLWHCKVIFQQSYDFTNHDSTWNDPARLCHSSYHAAKWWLCKVMMLQSDDSEVIVISNSIFY